MLDAARHRLRQGDHPEALATHRVSPYLFRGYWADVGTIESFYDANIKLTRPRRAVQVLPPALADLHAPALPAGDARVRLPPRRRPSSPRAAISIAARSTSRSSASARTSARARASRGRCCSAPTIYEEDTAADGDPARHRPRRRARSRHRGQERAHRRRRPAGERGRRASTPTATATTSATASSSFPRARGSGRALSSRREFPRSRHVSLAGRTAAAPRCSPLWYASRPLAPRRHRRQRLRRSPSAASSRPTTRPSPSPTPRATGRSSAA